MSFSSDSTDGSATPAFRRAHVGQLSFGKPSFATASQSVQPQPEAPPPSQITVRMPGSHLSKTVPFDPSQSSTFEAAILAASRRNDTVSGCQNRSANVLQQMFRSGRYSDLTVIAENGKEFHVHRSVLLPASRVLAKESEAITRLKISHGPEVVDSLIRHAYTMNVPILQADFPAQILPLASFRVSLELAVSKHVQDIERLLAAAIQYGMLELAAEAISSLSSALQKCSSFPWVIASTAIVIYGRDADKSLAARALVVEAAVPVLDRIMKDEIITQTLLKNADMMRDILVLAGQWLAERPKPVKTTDSSTPAPLMITPDSSQLEPDQHLGQKRRAESPGGSESNKRQKTGTE